MVIDKKREHITAWVTKYALTTGIQVVEGIVCHNINSAMLSYPGEYAHGNEWHRTKEAALDRAEEMRAAKIKALKKRIAKLETLGFIING